MTEQLIHGHRWVDVDTPSVQATWCVHCGAIRPRHLTPLAAPCPGPLGQGVKATVTITVTTPDGTSTLVTDEPAEYGLAIDEEPSFDEQHPFYRDPTRPAPARRWRLTLQLRHLEKWTVTMPTPKETHAG